MDKICRGSLVGDAHSQGGWANLDVPDTTCTARGTHLTITSQKLDTTDPGKAARNNRSSNGPSDTFRSQEWFRHDAFPGARAIRVPEVSHLSPRFWKSANAQSPAPSPRTPSRPLRSSRSHKSLPTAQDQAPAGRPPPSSTKPGALRAHAPHSPPTRARSEGVLRTAGELGVEVPPALEEYRGRGTGGTTPGRRAAGRSVSPTFVNSEDWMGYSSPRLSDHCFHFTSTEERERPASPRGTAGLRRRGGSPGEPVLSGEKNTVSCLWTGEAGYTHMDPFTAEDLMPSSNFKSGKTFRLHSGRQTENSESWNNLRESRSEALIERPAWSCTTSNGTAGVGFAASPVWKGRKCNIVKNAENMKRRLMLDASQSETDQSQRRHGFLTPNKANSPRDYLYVPSEGGGSRGTRAVVTSPQHRTSDEMSASLHHPVGCQSANQEFAYQDGGYTHQAGFQPEVEHAYGAVAVAPHAAKYLVGEQILNWHSHGRRGPLKCFQHATNTPAFRQVFHSSHPTGYAPQGPSCAPGMVNLRDHRNSDVVREHLQPMDTPLLQAPLVVSSASCPQRVYSYGELSSLPSTMPKDTAYLHSGLKVVKYGARMPGAFSPHVPRVLASQALPMC